MISLGCFWLVIKFVRGEALFEVITTGSVTALLLFATCFAASIEVRDSEFFFLCFLTEFTCSSASSWSLVLLGGYSAFFKT